MFEYEIRYLFFFQGWHWTKEGRSASHGWVSYNKKKTEELNSLTTNILSSSLITQFLVNKLGEFCVRSR